MRSLLLSLGSHFGDCRLDTHFVGFVGRELANCFNRKRDGREMLSDGKSARVNQDGV